MSPAACFKIPLSGNHTKLSQSKKKSLKIGLSAPISLKYTSFKNWS